MRRKREAGRLLLGLAIGAGLALATAESAEAIKTIPVKVSAPMRDYSFMPVSVVVSEKIATAGVREMPKGVSATACQSEPAGPGLVRLTFIADSMKKGESRSYELLPPGAGMRINTRAVQVKPNGKNADFLVNDFLITRYDTTTGPNKPYFYPVNGPNGKSIVRRWPMEQNTGETKDHPHHRGIFFTHGLMNGADFWLETEGKASKTVHTGFDSMAGGPYYGYLRAKTDWITKEGKKIAEDTRDVRLYPVAGGYLLDFTIAVKAVGGPLVWGDTKEGLFGIRVADSMRAELERKEKEEGNVAQGKIVSSTGLKDGATWGKPAAWVDYYGPVEGATVGIAVFDDPKNPRHPTTWHVRTYGLFAVNPFGIHDFDPAKKNDPKAGEMTTAENETTTFRYIVYVHKGTTEEARVADVYAAFAEPPTVELVAGQGGAR